jgi:hypothetical protein
MKSTFIILILSSILGVRSAQAASTFDEMPTEKEVAVNINDAYIPNSFDSNSESYVIVNGLFPNGCYRWRRADVNHRTGNVHEVKSVAAVSQGMCIMVLTPFTKEVRLGKLEAGKHEIRFVNGDGTFLKKELIIEE